MPNGLSSRPARRDPTTPNGFLAPLEMTPREGSHCTKRFLGSLEMTLPGGSGGLKRAAPLPGVPSLRAVAVTLVLLWAGAAGAGPQQPHPCPGPAACFLQGVAAFRDAQYDEAAAALEQALEDPLGGREYAHYYLLLSHWNAGRTAEAVALGKRFLRAYPTGPLTERVARLEAEGYRRMSDLLPAARAYERLISEQDAPDLRLAYGRVLESLERLSEAHTSYQILRRKWPRSAEAPEARGRARRIEEQVPRLKERREEIPGLREEQTLAMRERNWQEALALQGELLARPLSSYLLRQVLSDRVQALVNAGRLEEARRDLDTLVDLYPRSPEAPSALYLVGRGFWRRNLNSEAFPLLERLVDEYTDADDAAAASFVLGRIHLEGGDKDGAVRWFRYTRFLFPWTEWEREAAWWEAWSLYRTGDYAACADLLETLDKEGVWVPELVPRSRYWQSRCLEKQGNAERSRALYAGLVRSAPPDYYSLLARGRLGPEAQGNTPGGEDPAAAAPTVPGPDPEEARRELYGITLMLQEPVLPLLLEAGLRREAAERLDWARQRGATPAATLSAEDWVSAYSLAGDLARAIRAAHRAGLHDEALAGWPAGTEPPAGATRLLRRLYPLYHWDIVRAHSEAHGLDPYLVAGLIRQESLFQVDAVSPAGALGLMQIMPATGRRMAQELGIQDFETSRLMDPELNIRIGTAYLARLQERYGPDWNRILANYNAGPRPVARWTESMPDAEPDEFVENILYRETRVYVRRVTFNHDLYRMLYGGGATSVEMNR